MSVAYGSLLGGSWVVISGVISPLIWVISIVTLRIALLITTHEPPSRSTHSRVVAVSVALMDTDEMDLGLRSSPLHYK